MLTRTLAVLLFGSIVPLTAQGASAVPPATEHATLLRQFPPGAAPTFAAPTRSAPEAEYSMCTGHTDPATGREFAVAAAGNGLLFVDAVPPAHADDALTGMAMTSWFFEDKPASRWRGLASFGECVYAVSFQHPGIHRFAIRPSGSARTWIVDRGWSATADFTRAGPRTAIDREHGLLYVVGISVATQLEALFVYRLTDPTSGAPIDPPQLLAEWSPGAVVFDVFPRGDRAYLSLEKPGEPDWWRIIDVAPLWRTPPVTPRAWQPAFTEWRNTLTVPGALSHDSYVSPDASAWFVTMEGFGFGGHMTKRRLDHVPPLANGTMAEPSVSGGYHFAQPGVPQPMHAMRGIGLCGYVAHWSAGLHVIDLSEDRQGFVDFDRVAAFDTSPLAGTAIADGAWDCHPFQDSGVVYVTDSEQGLFLLRLDVGHLNRYGPGTGNGRTVPRLVNDGGPPRIGRTAVLGVRGLLSSGFGALAIGLGEDPAYRAGSAVSAFGAMILVDLAGGLIEPVFADDRGGAEHKLRIPNSRALIGGKVFAQLLEVAPAGLAASRGTWFGIAP